MRGAFGFATPRGPIKVAAVDSAVNVPYRYNDSFTALRGGEYFRDGVLQFPASDENRPGAYKDGSYHTHFGPCIAHSGVVYACNNHNVSQAFPRLTKCREPEIDGFEEWMQANQRSFITSHSRFASKLKRLYQRGLDDFTSMVDECIEHHADPHVKRAERVAAMRDLHEQNKLFDRLWYMDGKETEYKFKKFEFAKPGKPGRMIGNLHCPASLQGFRLTNLMKYAFAENPVSTIGGVMEFVPVPSARELERVFAQLETPTGRFYMSYFSDDACLVLRTRSGKLLRCNLDISSCDASHTQALFDLLVEITPDRFREDMLRLVEQCQTPIKIYDQSDHKRYVKLRPKHARLYSGSTLTTLINNLANILIGRAIAESEIDSYEDIVKAARRVGYVVTCEPCDDIRKLQFLKHSPVYDTTGRLRALLNMGVLFRLTGTCKGDLPGTRSEGLRARAEKFQAALLQGAYPRVSMPLVDRLKRNVSHVKPTAKQTAVVSKELLFKVDPRDDERYSVTPEEVWRRYDLTPLETIELEEGFASCGYGDHFQSTGAAKVLALDYKLGVVGPESLSKW